MKQRQWFHCGHGYSGDGLQRLRSVVLRLYQAKAFAHYGLVSVTVPLRVNGFDRIATRLSYSRILAESDVTSHVTLAGQGPVLALCRMTPAWDVVLDELRNRLAEPSGGVHPPSLRCARLPEKPVTAMTLLTELGTP